jgi:hypothetical protein
MMVSNGGNTVKANTRKLGSSGLIGPLSDLDLVVTVGRQLILRTLESMAGTTGLEPATSAVTGQHSNQLNYVPTATKQLSQSNRLDGSCVVAANPQIPF